MTPSRLDGPTGAVTHHHDQWAAQDGNAVFHRGDRLIEGGVASTSDDEKIVGCRIEDPFRGDAGVGTGQDRGPGGLASTDHFG